MCLEPGAWPGAALFELPREEVETATPDVLRRLLMVCPAALGEAESMVSFEGKRYALPQSFDGLALVRRRGSAGPWPPLSVDSWLGALHVAPKQPSIGILLDGYWFVAFLRASGASLPDDQGLPAADSPEAQLALTSFARLFRNGVAMDLLEERAPSRAMVKAFRRGELDQVLTGPWDLADLADGNLDELEVAAFPGGSAPRGGQVLVVPLEVS